jgi:tRNA A-37 threonylcarbamoyl transferase component Bud32
MNVKGIIPTALQDNLQIIGEFKSFKNKVYKVQTHFGNTYVLKIYSKTPNISNTSNNTKSMLEANNLTNLRLKNIKTPAIIDKSSDFLILEYVPGQTIAQLLSNSHSPNDNTNYEWLERFAQWMADLHKIKVKNGSFLKGDCNLRNFIWTGKEIYGLDFEEIKKGNFREDLGEICFFLLSNSPPLTPNRIQTIEMFLKSYEEFSGTKISHISDFIAKSARKAYKRRRKFNRL